ncbi:MAG: HD domain-containing protein [Bryobacterales bacterium]|nr:HD domain-containing protein [Bryobacterales bacterium]MBV9398413.1 HD domain-containing protein [Bryobacterales bacterium]
MNPIDEIVNLFATRGNAEYLGEPVSQKEHALQCADLAVRNSAPDALVAAALLHDIGHLLPCETINPRGEDRVHEEIAAAWLQPYFGPEVTEPIRLHVIAKRYLCSVEPSYYSRLSQPSIDTLGLQGGLLSSAEAKEFKKHPHFESALRVRIWDEAAKEPGKAVPGVPSYLALLRRLTTRD